MNSQSREEMQSLFSVCLTQNYLKFNDKNYIEKESLPMSSPLSPLLAEIFIDHLEPHM